MSTSDYLVLIGMAAFFIVMIFLSRRERKKGGGCHGDCESCRGCSQNKK